MADYGFVAMPEAVRPDYDGYDPATADHTNGELGPLTHGELLDQGTGRQLVGHYDEENHPYLLKDQCAACGDFGHFLRDCPNRERNFSGNPNEPKKLVSAKTSPRCVN